MADDIAGVLARLDARPEPAAERFDDGAPFEGAVAVLPSAFNPPTFGHEQLLRCAAEKTGARPVALLTTKNVEKSVYGASLAQRIEMLLAMHAGWPDLAVAACNQARIIDQAPAVADLVPSGVSPAYFVLGFDTLERLFAAHYYQDMELELGPFFEGNRVLAANRADVTADDVRRWVRENTGRFAGRIDILEVDDFAASLSSSQVRDNVATSRAPEAVPDAIRAYIEERGLYRAT